MRFTDLYTNIYENYNFVGLEAAKCALVHPCLCAIMNDNLLEIIALGHNPKLTLLTIAYKLDIMELSSLQLNHDLYIFLGYTQYQHSRRNQHLAVFNPLDLLLNKCKTESKEQHQNFKQP